VGGEVGYVGGKRGTSGSRPRFGPEPLERGGTILCDPVKGMVIHVRWGRTVDAGMEGDTCRRETEYENVSYQGYKSKFLPLGTERSVNTIKYPNRTEVRCGEHEKRNDLLKQKDLLGGASRDDCLPPVSDHQKKPCRVI